MKLTVYEGGKPREIHVERPGPKAGLVLEVVADQGQTVQLVVRPDGKVDLRGWGNTPILLGNMNTIHFGAPLPYEEPTCDEHGHRLDDNDTQDAVKELPL